MGNYLKNIINSIITKGIATGISFIITLLLGRYLGVENYGIYSFYMIIANFFIQYGHFGILNATTHFQKKSDYSESEVYSNNLNFVIVLWLFLSCLVLLIIRYGINIEPILPILITLFYILSQMISNLILRFLIGQERIYHYNNIEVLSKIASLILLVLLVFLNRVTLLNILFILTIIQFIKVLILMRFIKIKYEMYINFVMLKKEFLYGITIFCGSLFAFLNYRMDQFMIKFFMTNQDLGIYSLAVNISELVFLVPLSISLAFMGKIYNSEKKIIRDLTQKSTAIAFYISIIITIIVIIMMPVFIWILGPGYSDIRYILIVVLAGNIFSCFGQILSNYFFYNNQNVVHLKISFYSFLLNGILNLILIPSCGIYGAGIASLVSYIVYGGLYLMTFLKLEAISVKDFFLNLR